MRVPDAPWVHTLQRWPLPAVLAWLAAWALYRFCMAQALEPILSMALATALGVALSVLGATWWRRLLIGLGFPLSLALTGLVAFPVWGWLIALLLVLLVYPLNAWRDAPLFPTPGGALDELARYAPLPEAARVLDAGCGLGHGLIALRAAYPQAQLHGLEWSWPLRWMSALRCPWARIRRGDIWRADWSAYAVVYLFQRPESMARAVAKARSELAPGAWLISLEFAAIELQPDAHYSAPGGRMVWLYRAPFTESSGE